VGENMAKDSYDMNTILGEKSNYEGTMKVEGSIRIEGNFKGKIEAGSVVVGKSAVVEADITASNIIVGGEVIGNIISDSDLKLQKSAKVLGDIESAKLIIEEGAVLQGKCNMSK